MARQPAGQERELDDEPGALPAVVAILDPDAAALQASVLRRQRQTQSDTHVHAPAAALVAAVVLGETLRGGRVVAILAGLIGAAIIIRPGMVTLNVGVLYVLGVVAVQSWNPINRKLLSRSEHPDTVAIWVTLIILPWSILIVPFVWTTPTPTLLAWMAAIGILEVMNQRILSRAYVHGDAVVVVALHYTRLPIAALVGFLAFAEFPDIFTWTGGAVIAGAALYLSHREAAGRRKTAKGS